MDFAVLLFGTLKDAAGTDHILVTIPASSPMTVTGLLEHCSHQHPQIARWLPHVRVAVNLEYSGADKTLAAGDEIALIPPVAGGSCKGAALN